MNRQPVHDPVLTTKEEASLKAMSLEEVSNTPSYCCYTCVCYVIINEGLPFVCLKATIRRAELQKARALQSYYEAKAKRAKKIKSKK